MHQPELQQLEEAVKTATDPLAIVNNFIRCPEGTPPMPAYWVDRLCCLAEIIVRNHNA